MLKKSTSKKPKRGKAKTPPASSAATTIAKIAKDTNPQVVKTAFYIRPDTIGALGIVREELIATFPMMGRGPLSKSLLCQIALDIALEDYADKGKASEIYKRIKHLAYNSRS